MQNGNNLNLDKIWQLPSFKAPDGSLDQGDTVHNTFTLLYCGWNEIELKSKYFDLLTSLDGWPVRSPDTSKWYGKKNRCSRDALTPYLIYAASRPDLPYFDNFMHTMRSHGYLFANNSRRNFVYDTAAEHLAKSTLDVPWRPGWKLPDLLAPDIWAVCVRGWVLRGPAWAVPIAYPLLCLMDLQGLGSAIGRRLFGRAAVSDERNQALKLHFAGHYVPTLVSRLAYRLYAATRPIEAFKAFWGQPGEPDVAQYMAHLYP